MRSIFTTVPSTSSTSPGLMLRSASKMMPPTKFWTMFCIAKPRATAKTAPAAKRAPRSRPREERAVVKPIASTR